jgi:hypothetical protein
VHTIKITDCIEANKYDQLRMLDLQFWNFLAWWKESVDLKMPDAPYFFPLQENHFTPTETASRIILL